MKKAIRILACAAILGSAVITGCEKDSFISHKGESVKFSAVSKGGPTTKTSYAGDDSGYQIIDWKENDLVRVYSDNAVHRYGMTAGETQNWADYIIRKGPYAITGHESMASLQAKTLDNTTTDNHFESANGLVWDEEAENYNFWAIYPSPDQNSSISIGEAGAVTATLPSSTTLTSRSSTKTYEEGSNTYTYNVYAPNMNYAYMTAHATYNGEEVAQNDYKVNLEFYPAFTAFELNLTSADEDFSVSSISLTSNEWLSGKFNMTAGDLSTVTVPDGNAAEKTVAATFSNPVTVSSSTGISVTLFAIPLDITGKITYLTVNTDKGSAKLTFYKKGTKTPYDFTAGVKYRINLLKIGGRYQILFGDDDLTVEPWEAESVDIIVE